MLDGLDEDEGDGEEVLSESSWRATRDEWAEAVKRMTSASGSKHAGRKDISRGWQREREG